jgi:hypothetical protein
LITTRRRVAALTATALTAASLMTGLGLAVPASAIPAPTTLSLSSPAAGSTVVGDTAVTVHVVPGAGPIAAVTVRAQDVDGDTMTRTDPIPVGCGAGCDVVVDLPLGAATSDDPTGSPIWDGVATLAAWVDPAAPVTEQVTVNNQRPFLSCPLTAGPPAPDCDGGAVLGTASTLPMTVLAGAGASGAPVASVVFTPTGGGTPVSLTESAPGTWTGSADVSALTSAPSAPIGQVTITDTRGISAAAWNWAAVVDRSLSVAPEWAAPQITDDACLTLTVSHDTATGVLPGVRSVQATATIDGVPAGVNDYSTYGPPPMDIEHLNACLFTGTVYQPVALPTGSHTLSVTVTDSAGESGTWTGTVDVTPTMTATMSISPDRDLHRNEAVTVTGQFVSATASVSYVQLTDNGKDTGIAESGRPQPVTVTGTWYPYAYGTHTLIWSVSPGHGGAHLYSQLVDVLPDAAATLTPPTRAVPGQHQAFTATVHLASGAVTPAGLGVSLQYRATGATAWTTIAQGSTTSSGKAVFSVTARRTGAWRAVTITRPHAWWGTTGASITVRAVPTVALAVKVPRSGHVTATVTSVYAASRTPVKLSVFRSGHWVVLATGLLTSKGGWVTTVALTHGHRWSLRVTLAATATALDVGSATRTVTP